MELLDVIMTVFCIVSLCLALISLLNLMTERRKDNMRQQHLDERNEMLFRNIMQNRDFDFERRIINSNKGFSDEYDEVRMLLREVRSIRNELRREQSSTGPLNSDTIMEQFSQMVDQALRNCIQPDVISRVLVDELVDQLSVEHFFELKEEHYHSKIQDTSRTLLNVLHVLRTPLSGMKINIQALNKLNIADDPELKKKYSQISDAIDLIESNMRTLGAYEEISEDSCDLRERIRKNISLLLLTADKKVSLNIDSIPEGIVLLNTTIDNVLLCIECIVENAIAFAQDNSEIIINVSTEENICRIGITNFGSIISEEIGDKIFEDGFSMREGGHGIGLNLVKRVVSEKLNGNVSFENLPQKNGVKFNLTFEVV